MPSAEKGHKPRVPSGKTKAVAEKKKNKRIKVGRASSRRASFAEALSSLREAPVKKLPTKATMPRCSPVSRGHGTSTAGDPSETAALFAEDSSPPDEHRGRVLYRFFVAALFHIAEGRKRLYSVTAKRASFSTLSHAYFLALLFSDNWISFSFCRLERKLYLDKPVLENISFRSH